MEAAGVIDHNVSARFDASAPQGLEQEPYQVTAAKASLFGPPETSSASKCFQLPRALAWAGLRVVPVAWHQPLARSGVAPSRCFFLLRALRVSRLLTARYQNGRDPVIPRFKNSSMADMPATLDGKGGGP